MSPQAFKWKYLGGEPGDGWVEVGYEENEAQERGTAEVLAEPKARADLLGPDGRALARRRAIGFVAACRVKGV